MQIGRRRFLLGAGALGAAIGADAFGLEAHRVLLSRHDVAVPGLPAALDGLRIAQVSDVHLPDNQLAARAALEHLRRERPEVVVLSGDLTESGQAIAAMEEFAGAARGTLGTVAILGNWEYRAGVVGEAARAMYRRAGVDLLVNQSSVLEIGGTALALVGLDDILSGQPDLSTARAGLAADVVEVWVVHEPEFADQIPPESSPPAAMLL